VGEGDPFAPRFKLLAAVTQGVRWKHRFVVVFGTPRVGKTTFLHQLQQELRGELPICPVEFIWPTGADAETAQCELTSRVSSAVADARARWAQEHAADPQPTEEERALVLLDGLHVCDLCRPDGAQFIAQWQAWLESVPGWQFVVTLSGQRDGAVLCNPVLTALPYEELENLTLSETEDLLSRPVKEQLTYSYAAMRRIWQLTTGHPYQVQLFGSALLNKRGAGRRVELHDVERVAPDVVAAVNPLLEALWQTCSSQEQLLLALSNELHGRHGMLTPRDLLDAAHRNGLELPEQVLQDGLSALLAKGLVRRLSVGSYALASEVLRLWLNRFHALGSTLYNLSSQKHPLAVRSTALRPIRWGALLGSLAGLVLLLGWRICGARAAWRNTCWWEDRLRPPRLRSLRATRW